METIMKPGEIITKSEEIIGLIKNQNIEILDISTDDGDLEDVFEQMTKN